MKQLFIICLVTNLFTSNGVILNLFKDYRNRIITSLYSTTQDYLKSDAEYQQIWDKDAWVKGYETCREETVAMLAGNVPYDLEGTYYKNVGGKYEVNKDLVVHPFDADGMIAAITIENGQVLFRNRFVMTNGFKKEKYDICIRITISNINNDNILLEKPRKSSTVERLELNELEVFFLTF